MAKSKVPATPGKTSDLLDLIPKLKPMPGEDQNAMADLRKALLLDLSPSAPYERALAEQLVTLEFEMDRHRRMRDALILSEIREKATKFLHDAGSESWSPFKPSNAAKQFGSDLVSGDPARQSKALEKLGKLEIPADEVLAKAYETVARSVAIHEHHIAEAEQRRRKLRDDYDKLKASKAKPVEEAVLLDANDD